MSTSDASPRGPNDPCWRGLVDDAALFPPGNLPMAAAVAAHRRHRAAWYAPVVGPFVVAEQRLDELGRLLPGRPFPCLLVVSGGVAGALQRARRTQVPVVAVEVPVRGGDLAAAVDAVVVELGGAEPVPGPVAEVSTPGPDGRRGAAEPGVGRPRTDAAEGTVRGQAAGAGRLVLAVELPPQEPDRSWLAACDRVAAAGARLKLRTGGVEAGAFPSTSRLAAWLVAAAERDLAVKCTAGLHHAVRQRDPRTGFEHHGFLNVLVAVRALLEGAAEEVVRQLLERRDAGGLAATVAGWDAGTRGRVRQRFTGFGSCSTADPVGDLLALGLLAEPIVRGAPDAPDGLAVTAGGRP